MLTQLMTHACSYTVLSISCSTAVTGPVQCVLVGNPAERLLQSDSSSSSRGSFGGVREQG